MNLPKMSLGPFAISPTCSFPPTLTGPSEKRALLHFMILQCSDLGPTWGHRDGDIIFICSVLEAWTFLNPAALGGKQGSLRYTCNQSELLPPSSGSKRRVASAHLALHEAHCLLFLTRCPECKEPVLQAKMDEHRENGHQQVRGPGRDAGGCCAARLTRTLAAATGLAAVGKSPSPACLRPWQRTQYS